MVTTAGIRRPRRWDQEQQAPAPLAWGLREGPAQRVSAPAPAPAPAPASLSGFLAFLRQSLAPACCIPFLSSSVRSIAGINATAVPNGARRRRKQTSFCTACALLGVATLATNSPYLIGEGAFVSIAARRLDAASEAMTDVILEARGEVADTKQKELAGIAEADAPYLISDLAEKATPETRPGGTVVVPRDHSTRDSEILLHTFGIYGTLGLCLLGAYLFLRPRFPAAYNVRETVPSLRCAASGEPFGTFSWMWRVFFVPYDDIYEQCGLDAASFVRFFDLGGKLSLVGMLNSLYLFPVYYWIGKLVYNHVTAQITDPVQKLSLSNIPPGHDASIACAVSAYVFFGISMLLLLKEFVWFTSHRHCFLAARRPDNYTVTITGIPQEYRSNDALLSYFLECFTQDSILEVHIALNIPQLEKKVAERDALVAKLEHAINVLIVKGIRPVHKSQALGISGNAVDSIDVFSEKLGRLNGEISEMLDMIELINGGSTGDPENTHGSPARDEGAGLDTGHEEELATTTAESSLVPRDVSLERTPSSSTRPMSFSKGRFLAGYVRDTLPGAVVSSATDVVSSLLVHEDSQPRDAAFVTFSSLNSANSALQRIHEGRPFIMEASDAPRPEDIFWGNVGLPHARKQLGGLLSFGLTVIICLFWTVPITFFASLSNIERLTEVFPFLDPIVKDHPWMGELLAQLAPLLVLGLNTTLPYILQYCALAEGHIAKTAVQSSLFVKLAWFTLIQTFFVSLISSSITEEIQHILEYPHYAIDIMAKALPGQSAYFCQIIIVATFLRGVGMELLRIPAVGMAAVRHCVGPRLTEKERRSTWMGLRPLADPPEYLYARELGVYLTLLFMVLFVYACMAPLTSYVTGFCFALLAMVARNQFLYIYPTHNDSGGRLWVGFVRTILISMIIAQTVLVAVLSLKKAAIAATLLTPLPLITVLFLSYVSQKHFQVTEHLPTTICMKEDRKNAAAGGQMDYSFVRGKYIQPAMQHRVVLPDNYPERNREA